MINWFQSDNRPIIFGSVVHIPLWIFISKELEVVFKFFGISIASPPVTIVDFIEWFGLLYGVLVSLMLLKVWEQLDAIDREFDKEVNKARILYKDLSYLSGMSGPISKIGVEITKVLRVYVVHVINNYKSEIKQSDDVAKITGDKILEELRGKFKRLINFKTKQTSAPEIFVEELFERLNELVDTRGYRISLVSQRVFENLYGILLVTSIVFLIPFYFAGFTSSSGYILDTALVISVTFLVIYVYMIIEDLDDPFDGPKSISDESWRLLLEEMDNTAKKTKRKPKAKK